MAALPAGLEFQQGATNGLILVRGGKRLAIYGDPLGKIARAEMVLLTHARRDVNWAADELIARGTQVMAPEGDRFSGVEKVWEEIFDSKRLHDYENQGTKFGLKSFGSVRRAERLDWEGVVIEPLSTPGYTRGAVSYSFEWGGKRVVATGDLIYAGARIFDLYSLQDAVPELKLRGYHGFASRMAELIASLERVLATRPDLLVPSRGPLVLEPGIEIPNLIEKLRAVYSNYMTTDAYRWYFGPDNYVARGRRILGKRALEGMPYAETVRKELPAWMKIVNNSRLIVSKSGEAILVDCGSTKNLEQVRAWQREGVFQKMSAVYVTHYHDDHTDFAQATADEFGAALWSSSEQARILREPANYRMPCLTPNPIPGLAPWKDGEAREWNEFRLRSFYFPGQTLYHGALLVEPKEDGAERVLFVGDSFTPSGMDDYCLLNRNLLGAKLGLSYCLGLLEKMPDCLLVNQHVEPLFRFSKAQLGFMRQKLEERRGLIEKLIPFDGANYGVDEQWFRLDPYVKSVRRGERFLVQAVVMNHSPGVRAFEVKLELPAAWTRSEAKRKIRVNPGEEKAVSFDLAAPGEAVAGVAVITASIRFGEMDLRHWAEALIRVS